MKELKLSETEYYIMNWFWEKGPMKTGELSELVADRKWKPTTLLTFLSRLVSKGMLKAQKEGKGNLYIPVVDRDTYRKNESRAFLDQMYGGSARDFLAAMVDSRGISDKELDELKEWLSEQEVCDHE